MGLARQLPPDEGRPLAGARVVSIVSHGQTHLIEPLLADLIALPPPSLDRLVLTLNLQEEALPAVALGAAPFAIQIIRNPAPKGFGANHNAAFAAALAHGPVAAYAMLNPDLRLSDPDVLVRLWAALDEGMDLVAPAVIEKGVVAASARCLYTPWQAFKAFAGLGRKLAASPDWLAGVCLAVRASSWCHIGGFDERFFMYCEDVDLSLRLQLAGGKISYLPQVRVLHQAQRDSHRSLRAFGWHLGSAVRLWCGKSFWRYWLFRRSVGRAAPSGAPRSAG